MHIYAYNNYSPLHQYYHARGGWRAKVRCSCSGGEGDERGGGVGGAAAVHRKIYEDKNTEKQMLGDQFCLRERYISGRKRGERKKKRRNRGFEQDKAKNEKKEEEEQE